MVLEHWVLSLKDPPDPICRCVKETNSSCPVVVDANLIPFQTTSAIQLERRLLPPRRHDQVGAHHQPRAARVQTQQETGPGDVRGDVPPLPRGVLLHRRRPRRGIPVMPGREIN